MEKAIVNDLGDAAVACEVRKGGNYMMDELPIISKNNVCTGHEECFSDCTNVFFY